MPSSYPGAPDDLSAGNTSLTHGQVSDAVAAIEATLGVNPQGAAADVAARFDGLPASRPALLSGTTAPLSGSGLYPLDGVNDPWRYFPPAGGWVAYPHEVTWTTGDQTASFAGHLPAGAGELAVFIGEVTTPTEANNNPGQFYQADIGVTGTIPASNGFIDPIISNTPLAAIADGAGIAFLFQAEPGFTGPTAVPDPTLDATTLATLLGDVTLGAPYTFDETGDGQDGDYWFNTTTGELYGPKTSGDWGPPRGTLLDPHDDQRFYGGLYAGPSDDPDQPTLTVVAGNEPPDNYLGLGTVSFWFDATAGAPTLHVKAMDDASAIYTGTIPLTAV